MFLSRFRKGHHQKIEKETPKKKEVSEEALLREAYRVGRYSPTNSECPPAPNIIPVWVQNNIWALEKYVDRLFAEWAVPPEIEPRLFLSMYFGFRDLVLSSHHDKSDSPFSLPSQETNRIAKQIFVELAARRGHRIEIDC